MDIHWAALGGVFGVSLGITLLTVVLFSSVSPPSPVATAEATAENAPAAPTGRPPRRHCCASARAWRSPSTGSP